MSMGTKRFPLWQKPSSRVYLRHQAQNGFFGGASSLKTNRYPAFHASDDFLIRLAANPEEGTIRFYDVLAHSATTFAP